VPVAILAATRVGIVTPKQLRHNRRYAVLACAAIAAFLPGDAVTLILETVPLYVLYEVSILIASLVARRDAARERAAAAGREDPPGGTSGPGGVMGPPPSSPSPSSPAGSPDRPVEPSPVGTDDGLELGVKQRIDHIDHELS
jgi:hypothetical protein